MMKRIGALSKFKAQVLELRVQGMQADEIAGKLGVSLKEVRKGLRAITRRYVDQLGRYGKANILAEQALAVEASMVALSSLATDKFAKAGERIQAIRAREELRKDWLNLLAQSGIVEISKSSYLDSVTAGMTPEQKRKLIKLGLKRIKQLQAMKEAPNAAKPAADDPGSRSPGPH